MRERSSLNRGAVAVVAIAILGAGMLLAGFFLAVPDAPDGPIAPLSGLPTNNGADPFAVTPQLVGAINGLAPAQGAWLIGAMFWFGGPEVPQYFWRVSVK